MTKPLQGEKFREFKDDSRDVRRIWGFIKSFCLDVACRGVNQWQNNNLLLIRRYHYKHVSNLIKHETLECVEVKDSAMNVMAYRTNWASS